MADEQMRRPPDSGIASEAQRTTGARARALQHSGGIGHEADSFQGECGSPVWSEDETDTGALRKFVKTLKKYRGTVTRLFGAHFGMQAKEAVPEYIVEMIRESHSQTANEDDVTDDQAYKELTDK